MGCFISLELQLCFNNSSLFELKISPFGSFVFLNMLKLTLHLCGTKKCDKVMIGSLLQASLTSRMESSVDYPCERSKCIVQRDKTNLKQTET